MARYLLLYIVDHREERRQAVPESHDEFADAMLPWLEWFAKAGDSIVDGGSPLGPVDKMQLTIGGYSIVEAEDRAALDTLLEGHPAWDRGGITAHEILRPSPTRPS